MTLAALLILAALALVGALLALRHRARTLAGRAAVQLQANALAAAGGQLVKLHHGHAIALGSLPNSGGFDGATLAEVYQHRAHLLRDGRPVASMSRAAWDLLQREADEWERAAKLAATSLALRPPASEATRPARCDRCGGRHYSPKPTTRGALCAAAFHAPRPA